MPAVIHLNFRVNPINLVYGSDRYFVKNDLCGSSIFLLFSLVAAGNLRSLDATNGIKVRATNRDETRAAHIDRPKSCMKTPILDFERNTNGTKTHIVVVLTRFPGIYGIRGEPDAVAEIIAYSGGHKGC